MANNFSQRLVESIKVPALFVLILWAIHVVNSTLNLNLATLGILPREIIGLRGVIFSPLIHSDYGHLINNSVPLFVLSAMTLFFYRKVAYSSFFIIYILSGLAVWLLGRTSFHIGASGVIFGLMAFIMASGFFRRNLKSIALALVVVFYYGATFLMGIRPGQEGISWEGHLLGGVFGILTAYFMKDRIEKDEQPPSYSWQNEIDEPQSYLNPETFSKTKSERRNERGSIW